MISNLIICALSRKKNTNNILLFENKYETTLNSFNLRPLILVMVRYPNNVLLNEK